MLMPEQVVPFLQLDDSLVLNAVRRYFGDSFDFGPLTAEHYWSVIDRLGENDLTVGFASHLDDVPQTDASLHRLVRALGANAPERFEFHYQIAARNLELPVMARNRAELLAIPELLPHVRSHLELRLNLLDEPPASAWQRLMQHGRELRNANASEFDTSLSDALIEAAARGGEPVCIQAMPMLSDDSAADDWRQIFAVRVLGLARYQPAVDPLVGLLAIDADVLREETNRSLAHIGTTQVIDSIVSFYPGQPWHVRLYAGGPISRIKRPASESALLTLLGMELAVEENPYDEDEEEDNLVISVLQDLAELGSLAGLAESRRWIADFPDDGEVLDLCQSLLAAAFMSGTNLPEESDWRKRVQEWERDIARRISDLDDDIGPGIRDQWRKTGISFPRQPIAAIENDPFLPPDAPPAFDSPRIFDDPADYTPVQPIRNTTPKTGRNDPCPCGSGKKYKKCCGK